MARRRGKHGIGHARRDPRQRRPWFELLEDRRLLANVTVGNLSDVVNGDTSSIASLIASNGGDGISLREAVLAANADGAADVIDFSVTGTIQLTNVGHVGEIAISSNLTINGPGASVLTIRAFDPSATLGDGARIFNINDFFSFTTKTVAISGLTLTGGDSADNGGAIRNAENLTISGCTISGNRAGPTNVTVRGGGIANLSGNLSVIGSTISGNSSFGSGGGIYSDLGSLMISQSTISGNTSGSNGGGIHCAYSNTTIDSSTISGNSAGGGGGIVGANASATMTITNSTISGNSASGAGGGVVVFSGTANVRHSTITLNRADSDNNASGTGGGVFGNATIEHTIVAGNLRSVSTRDDIAGSVVASSAFNLIGVDTGLTGISNGTNGNQIGTGAAPIDARLAVLFNNGGPTFTHAFLAGSPAIDMGDPAVPSPPTNDQRGAAFARVADGDGAGGAQIDIGAFEQQTLDPFSLVVDTLADEDDGNYSAGDFSLREAIGVANGSIGPYTITFAAALSGATITLGGTELEITEAVTIDATALAENVTIDANELSRIFNITATTGDFTLGGLTLTGGRTTGNDVFQSNIFHGGAIRSLTTGNLTLDQSAVSGNSTAGSYADGGGIFSIGAVTLTQSTVSENTTAGNRASGGGILSSDVTLTQSTVSGNSTTGNSARGGGISAYGAVTLAQSTVSGNSTAGFAAYGGGIRASGAVTLTQSTVSGNSTSGGGADGGGIWGGYGAVTLTQSTITENHALEATAMGGGVFQVNTFSNWPFSITGSLVAGNTASGGGDDLVPDPDSTLNVNYSLVGVTPAGMVGIGIIAGLDPLLGPLANNGGPTETHALLPGSPAIDMGDPGFMGPPDYDQRGFAYSRVIGGRIDMGAFEFGATSADFDEDGDVDGLDFLAWQIGFGTPAPNAVKGDGDADNDLDVDGDDLAAWENAYGAGGGAPLTAPIHEPTALAAGSLGVGAATDSPAAPSSERADPAAVGSRSFALNAQLVDLALADGIDETDGTDAELREEGFVGQGMRERVVVGSGAAAGRVADFGDIAVSRPREDESSVVDGALDEEVLDVM